MIFAPTRLEDAWLDIEPRENERGFFARTWCRQELAAQGLDTEIAQESESYNLHRGTVRCLHFQRSPHERPRSSGARAARSSM
jgi:dTDP-4-dehydrorhamnose 3,5-epimerase